MNLYVVDTSSLIDLSSHYPKEVFPSIWKNIEALVHANLFAAPMVVFVEISPSNKLLYGWCKNHKSLFRPGNNEIARSAGKIMKEYPHLIDPNKSRPDADPYVIALAISIKNSFNESVILTQENNRPNKIPYVAKHYHVSSMSLLELFVNEKWSF